MDNEQEMDTECGGSRTYTGTARELLTHRRTPSYYRRLWSRGTCAADELPVGLGAWRAVAPKDMTTEVRWLELLLHAQGALQRQRRPFDRHWSTQAYDHEGNEARHRQQSRIGRYRSAAMQGVATIGDFNAKIRSANSLIARLQDVQDADNNERTRVTPNSPRTRDIRPKRASVVRMGIAAIETRDHTQIKQDPPSVSLHS